MTEPDPHDPRPHLALALDVDDLDDAVRLARQVQPHFGVAKVGLQLYSASGPRAIEALRDAGFEVFADLKLHDIPATVEKAARVVGRTGARMLTLHTQGGGAMVRAGCEGLADGAAEAGFDRPMGLGVTVLTSDATAAADVLTERARLAADEGCGGLVCAAPDLPVVRGAAPGLRAVVPGIRLAGGDQHDQARVATPASAIAAGADLLVIGRAVTHAADPVAAAATVAAAVRAALAR